VFRLFRTLPWFRVLAISKLALTARRHLRNLTPAERRRLGVLLWPRRGRGPAELAERRRLVSKLDARAFGATAVGAFAPWPIGRMARGSGRRWR
jgi:hypothetical protein